MLAKDISRRRTKGLSGNHSDERHHDVLPQSPIAENVNDVFKVDVDSSAGGLLRIVNDDSSGKNMNFSFAEHFPFGKEERPTLGGGFGKEEEPNDPKTDGHHTLDHEQPLPSCKTAIASQGEESGSDDAGESLSANVAEIKGGVADGVLALLVPCGEVEQGAGNETCFETSDEEASDEESGAVGAENLESGDKTPKDDLNGDPNASSNLGVSNRRQKRILFAKQCWMEFQR